MQRVAAGMFLVLLLGATRVRTWEETPVSSNEANPLGSETFCTGCRSTMRIIGTEYIYVGSQILTASESLLMFCRRIVVPGADLCGSIISRTGGILGYSAQTAGEALVVFCGLNPLCSSSTGLTVEELVVTYPDTFVCVDCLEQVKKKFHKEQVTGSLHVGAVIEKFCALSPRWGAKSLLDFFSCQRKIQEAVLKDRDASNSRRVTLKTSDLCYYSGQCPKAVIDYLKEHPLPN